MESMKSLSLSLPRLSWKKPKASLKRFKVALRRKPRAPDAVAKTPPPADQSVEQSPRASVATRQPGEQFASRSGGSGSAAAAPSAAANNHAAPVVYPPRVLDSIEFNRGTVHAAMTKALTRTETLVALLADRDETVMQNVADTIANDLRDNFMCAFVGKPEPLAVEVAAADAQTFVVAEIHRAVFDQLADTFRTDLSRDVAKALHHDFMSSEQYGLGHRDLPAERVVLRDALVGAVQEVLGARGLASNHDDANASRPDIKRLRTAVSALVMAFACVFIVHPLYRLDWLAPNTRFDESTAQPPIRWLSSRLRMELETARIACVVLPRVDAGETEEPDDCPFRSVVVVYPAEGTDDDEPVSADLDAAVTDRAGATVAATVEVSRAVHGVAKEIFGEEEEEEAAIEPESEIYQLEMYAPEERAVAAGAVAFLEPVADQLDQPSDDAQIYENHNHDYADENEYACADEYGPATNDFDGSYEDRLAFQGRAFACPAVLAPVVHPPALTPGAVRSPVASKAEPAVVVAAAATAALPLPPSPRDISFGAAASQQFPPRTSSTVE
ncbi:hypothetical protein H9P43_002711 [Blastocladiella emersonii ATCC 22665]|nr:hypothetical protein H9P43_002711 [Blastocladiella emersonii ATCC 22665]